MNKKDKTKFNIIIIIAIILFTIANTSKYLPEDTFYMIKVGEYIQQNGIGVILNRIEPFSWIEGLTYTYPHWLLDVIIYQIYNLCGFDGIYAFTVLVGITIYLLIYFTNIKIRQKPYDFSHYSISWHMCIKSDL